MVRPPVPAVAVMPDDPVIEGLAKGLDDEEVGPLVRLGLCHTKGEPHRPPHEFVASLRMRRVGAGASLHL